MSYGLDFSEVRYETDHSGNRLKATIPFSMFSALTEFWIAARRAQTAKLEATTRPGQYKGSLQAAQIPTPDQPAATSPPHHRNGSAHPSDRKWNALLASLPEQPAAEPTPTISPPASEPPPIDSATKIAVAPPKKRRGSRVFYREFVEAPPAEIMQRIAGGTYFIRAWREHRGLTLNDAADLFGRDKTTIIWHESGKTPPSALTLAKFASIYDCPVEQLSVKPGSDTSPFDGARVKQANADAEPKHRTISEPRAPAHTDYPEAVLAHLMTGKSPMLAWRLYRGLTLKALADAYGGREPNMKSMEANAWLRRTSIDKLCPIFRCKPEQLLRPEGMPTDRALLKEQAALAAANGNVAPPASAAQPKAATARKAKVAGESAPSAMEAAFMQAGTLEPRKEKERDRSRNDRLARMQAELAQL